MNNFKKYLEEVKEQLECNASEEFKNQNITYDFENNQIDNNLVYFKNCMQSNLSSYKALLFFNDYLTNH